jgi:hypothetical protein
MPANRRALGIESDVIHSRRCAIRSPARLGKGLESLGLNLPQIAAADRYASAIKEFEDNDRELASGLDAIAKQRGGDGPVTRSAAHIRHHLRHLMYSLAAVIAVRRDFDDLAHLG